MAEWLIDAADNYFEWQPYNGEDETEFGIAAPTHWMPLPEAPK